MVNVRKYWLKGIIIAIACIMVFYLIGTSAFTVLITAIAVIFLNIAVFRLSGNLNKASKAIVQILALVVSIIIFSGVTVQTIAPSFLFKPNFDEEAYNQLLNTKNAEEISIKTDSGEIVGWFLHNTDDSAPLVLYFGGNAENSASHILSLADGEIDNTPYEGYNFAFFDYPSYGKSTGTLNEEALKEYGLTVYDYLISRSDVEEIVVMGYSIGTGVANYVSSMRDVEGLILMAPYSSGYDLYNSRLPVFHGAARLLVSYKMESDKFAENITVKPLIFASISDKVIPYESSKKLSEKYPSGSDFVTLEGVAHNEFLYNKEVSEKIREYLSGLQESQN